SPALGSRDTQPGCRLRGRLRVLRLIRLTRFAAFGATCNLSHRATLVWLWTTRKHHAVSRSVLKRKTCHSKPEKVNKSNSSQARTFSPGIRRMIAVRKLKT